MNISAFWAQMRGHFGSLLGKSETHPSGPPQQQMLDDLLKQLDEMRLAALEQAALRVVEVRHEEARQAEQDLAEAHQAEMFCDIMEMHHRLKTNLDEPTLRSLADELHQHCSEFRSLHSEHLPQLVTYSIAQRFHNEALKSGWDLLAALMENASVSWPDPEVSPAKLEQAKIASLAECKEDFLKSPILRFADLMFGVVPIWRSVYPHRGGLLWQQTVLFSVGGALAAQAHHVTIEAAHARHFELEALLSERLTPKLQDIQQRLANGVATVAQANALSDEAVRLCQEIAPDLIWHQLHQPL
jgi:hypothetical protein